MDTENFDKLVRELTRTQSRRGALLGLVAYGTYDMSNLSTLKNWSVSVTIVDMAWGMTLSAVAATCGYLVTTWIATRGGG